MIYHKLVFFRLLQIVNMWILYLEFGDRIIGKRVFHGKLCNKNSKLVVQINVQHLFGKMSTWPE